MLCRDLMARALLQLSGEVYQVEVKTAKKLVSKWRGRTKLLSPLPS